MLKALTLVVALAASIAARQDSKLTDITGTWVIEVESHQLGLEVEQKGTASRWPERMSIASWC